VKIGSVESSIGLAQRDQQWDLSKWFCFLRIQQLENRKLRNSIFIDLINLSEHCPEIHNT
jgi:hypothetical protein